MHNFMFSFIPTGDYNFSIDKPFEALVNLDDIYSSIHDIFGDKYKNIDNFDWKKTDEDSCGRMVISVTFDVHYTDYDGIESLTNESWDVYVPVQDIKDFYAELEEVKLNAEYI